MSDKLKPNERPARSFSLKDGTYQIIAAVIVKSMSLHAGINIAFSTILLPDIMQVALQNGQNNSDTSNFDNITDVIDENSLKVDGDEASWIASIVTLAVPVGSLLAGLMMDIWGRKLVCALTNLPLIIAWFLTASVSTNVYIMYVARFLAGIGGGLSTVSIAYVAETSHPKLRPMLLNLLSVCVSFGILLTTVLGQIMSWRGVAIFNGFLAILNLVVIFFIPESPIWLYRQKKMPGIERNAAVLRSIQWLYRKTEHWQEAYNVIVSSENKGDPLLLDDESKANGNIRRKSIIRNEHPTYSTWKPMLVLCGIFFLQQFSGCFIIIFYASQFFKAVGSVELSPWISLVSLGVIRFTMAILNVYLSRFIGRRPLLISSFAGMAVSMVFAYGFLYIMGPSLFAALSLLVFITFLSYGVIAIPWSIIGELLPHHFRGKGSGIMVSFAYVLMFVTVKISLQLLEAIGVANFFCIFGIFSLLGVVFVYFFVPETLGKSFDEIAKSF